MTLNVLFPPLAVMMITGPNEDFIFNCVMFLLAVIPSHVHGFYVSFVYFTRKRRVRRGVYPGKPKHLIWSDRVNNGGASRRDMERLRYEEEEKRLGRRAARRMTTGASASERSSSSRRVQEWDDGYKDYSNASSPVSPVSSRFGAGRRSHHSGGRSPRQLRERSYDEYSDY